MPETASAKVIEDRIAFTCLQAVASSVTGLVFSRISSPSLKETDATFPAVMAATVWTRSYGSPSIPITVDQPYRP